VNGEKILILKRGFDLKKGLIFDIDRFSAHDGPGIRAAVFLKGCPLSCKWCHSPESQKDTPELIYQKIKCVQCGKCAESCAEKAISFGESGMIINRERCISCFVCAKSCATHALNICGVWHEANDILETVIQDKPFYINSGGGVTVTGGEVLIQPEFTIEFLTLCRQSGIDTAVETCGFGSQKALLDIADLCSLIFYDIKFIDDEQHKKYTGAGNSVILNNLAALCEHNAEKITVRVPCIPDINDSPEQIAGIARLAKKYGIKHIELMPYNAGAGAKYEWLCRPYELAGAEPREQSYYDNLTQIINDILK
jgi:pyruvate formate lyase activating enzyme